MLKLLALSLTMFGCAGSALFVPRVTSAPDVALKSTVDALLANLKLHAPQYRKDERSFYAMVDQVVVPRFDVPGIAQFALGRNGRKATSEQRQRFADALALILVHSYAGAMLERYDTMRLSWSPVRIEAGATRVKIGTVLSGEGGVRYPVGFSLRLVDGDWKIYDLEVEGVSLALNYRSQLGAEIRRTSLDAVITRMSKKDAALLKAVL